MRLMRNGLFALLLMLLLPTSFAAASVSSNLPPETYGLSLCQNPQFKCIKVRHGRKWYQVERQDYYRDLVMRLNRTNVALKYRDWIIVPRNIRKIHYMQLSPLPQHIKPTGKRLIVIDLRKFAFGAYKADGQLAWWGPATGGKAWCDDLDRSCKSAAGVFKIYRIQGANCRSSKYPLDENGGAPMPYCMHYYKGFAIHGSTLSGFQNRSRGCVRLFNADAKWLSEDFAKIGTKVIVCRKHHAKDCEHVEATKNNAN